MVLVGRHVELTKTKTLVDTLEVKRACLQVGFER